MHLLDLVNDLLCLTSDIDDQKAKASSTTPAELETRVWSAIEPVKASMDKELALAIKTAETAIKSSFDTSVHALNNNVAASIKAFEKKIDALHGSSYGHLTKTTLPEFARLINVLEAHTRLAPPIPTNQVDPSDNKDVEAKGDAVADDGNGANNRCRVADNASTQRRSDAAADVDDGLNANSCIWNACSETHARNGLDPTPASSTMTGPPRASFHAAVGSGRGCTPVISPYLPPSARPRSLRQCMVPSPLHG